MDEHSAEQEPQHTKAEEDAANEQAAQAAETAAPPPAEIKKVECQGCQGVFELPVEANVVSFAFDCTNCGAHNEVEIER